MLRNVHFNFSFFELLALLAGLLGIRLCGLKLYLVIMGLPLDRISALFGTYSIQLLYVGYTSELHWTEALLDVVPGSLEVSCPKAVCSPRSHQALSLYVHWHSSFDFLGFVESATSHLGVVFGIIDLLTSHRRVAETSEISAAFK